MSDVWAEEASEAEQLQLAQHFLLSSPPGQVHEVLRDVARLVPPRVLTDAALRGALHAHNVRSLLPVDVPDADYKVIICAEGEVDAGHYVDPVGGRVLGFDHTKQQFIAGDVAEIPAALVSETLEKDRRKVQQALQSYLQFEYMHGCVGTRAASHRLEGFLTGISTHMQRHGRRLRPGLQDDRQPVLGARQPAQLLVRPAASRVQRGMRS